MLQRVSATENTRSFLEYGRPAAVVLADDGKLGRGPYSKLQNAGVSPLVVSRNAVKQSLNFDPLAVDTAAIAGQDPARSGIIIGGFTPGSVQGALDKLGGTKVSSGSTTQWRFRDDDTFGIDDPLGKAIPDVVSKLDLVALDGNSLRYASSSSTLDITDASAKTSLAADPSIAAIAKCLADPLAVLLVKSEKSTANREIGIGESGAKGTTPVETLCIATASDTEAKTTMTELQSRLAGDTTTSTKQRWSELLTNVKVVVLGGAGHIVELTANPTSGNAGVLFNAAVRNDLAALME